MCFQDAKGCKRAFSGSRGTGKSRHEGVQGGWAVRQTSHLTRFNWTTRAGRRFRRGLIDTGKKVNTSLVFVQNSRFPDESLRSHVGHTGPKWWHKSFSWGDFAWCTFLYWASVAKSRQFSWLVLWQCRRIDPHSCLQTPDHTLEAWHHVIPQLPSASFLILIRLGLQSSWLLTPTLLATPTSPSYSVDSTGRILTSICLSLLQLLH